MLSSASALRQRCSVWIGFDPREAAAYAVCRSSIRRRLTQPLPINGLVLDDLRRAGLFWRQQELRDGKIWDVISGAPCATEFSISRFLVPHLAEGGWALFMDCDMLARESLARLFELRDPSKAVMVVKHDHRPTNAFKMDGQVQTSYARKNWSSLMLWNCEHPSTKKLTVEMVNTLPGRDLHRFCWLEDDEIGELPVEWNWLAGHCSESIDPCIVHHTDGTPAMPGYEHAPYAEEWRRELALWASVA